MIMFTQIVQVQKVLTTTFYFKEERSTLKCASRTNYFDEKPVQST